MKVFTAILAAVSLLPATSALPTTTSPPHPKRTVAPDHEYCQSFQHNGFTGLKYGVELGVDFNDGERCNFVYDSLVNAGVEITAGSWICQAPFGNPAETYFEFDVAAKDGWIPDVVNEVVDAIYGDFITGGIYCLDPYSDKRGVGEAGGRHLFARLE
ncbi:hypothetical protein EJ03DRAFT_136585 [Teratosphaeria nubilosa]|uniref:Ecp2 effector protein domain-containing protein n=1 Tax=Teratosphaeria nubilosa TaxID=161662 RepID=A0A6G1L5H8_9PEZI|nr:hypothetical protein EJ03DRAFT_136585 [Teratosphaeria nubilosa]